MNVDRNAQNKKVRSGIDKNLLFCLITADMLSRNPPQTHNLVCAKL
ncbi:MAG: hypothetical protein ACI8UX_002321 [Psychromonas sp.]|jgi:hypothetical protein